MQKQLVTIITGLASALIVDLHGYVNAKKTDPNAKWDWDLTAARVMIGGLAGIAGGVVC